MAGAQGKGDEGVRGGQSRQGRTEQGCVGHLSGFKRTLRNQRKAEDEREAGENRI